MFFIASTAFTEPPSDKVQQSQSSNDSIIKEQIRVSINTYKTLTLTQYENGRFDGNIQFSVWKINRRGERKKKITERYNINDSVAESLFNFIEQTKFRRLNEIQDSISQNQKDVSQFTDPSLVVFNYWSKNDTMNVKFINLEQKDESLDETPLDFRIANTIYQRMDSSFESNRYWKEFKNKLRPGRYQYSMIILKVSRF
ncbi:hypothetical protein GYB22_12315 [bacterium]|nr:hypothetical protein [bacterium]